MLPDAQVAVHRGDRIDGAAGAHADAGHLLYAVARAVVFVELLDGGGQLERRDRKFRGHLAVEQVHLHVQPGIGRHDQRDVAVYGFDPAVLDRRTAVAHGNRTVHAVDRLAIGDIGDGDRAVDVARPDGGAHAADVHLAVHHGADVDAGIRRHLDIELVIDAAAAAVIHLPPIRLADDEQHPGRIGLDVEPDPLLR